MTFTIFTPTYNRANTLDRLYNSIRDQDYKDFEWIIIDDGSADNTSEIVEKFIGDNMINIRFLRQKNSGKHRAINKAVSIAKGELFVTLDSDDVIRDDFLSKLFQYWRKIPVSERNKYSGVESSSCYFENGQMTEKIIGSNWPKKEIISNYLDIVNKEGIIGDKHGFIRTDVMKEYPFPEFSEENFLTEATVWFAMGQKYKTVFVDERLICKEYRSDGLSRNIRSIFKKNPRGSMYFREMIITIDYPFSAFNLINNQAQYFESAYFCRKNPFTLRKLKKIKSKWLFFVSMPLAVLLFIYDLRY